jgi:precorrin-6B methylase 2
MATITVEIINGKAYQLLEDLAELNVIRIHNSSGTVSVTNEVVSRLALRST